ncbi:MAG TPA: hypothetical protein VE591_12465 [Candidatus Acidoferrum sp.]|jgi:hypothetical protein|nr:hypothetical protein [Candidatus Acidoferrum sp.]
MSGPAIDVVLASNAGAAIGAIVALPQILKAIREPQSLKGLSNIGLVLQVVVGVLFTYVNARLSLWIAAAQTTGAVAAVGLIAFLKIRNEGRLLARRVSLVEREWGEPGQRRALDPAEGEPTLAS